jgi:hypothetical protein
MHIPPGTVLAREESALTITPVEAVAATLAERGQRHLKRVAGVSERGVDHIETMDGPEILNSVDEIEKLDKVARRTYGLKEVADGGHFTLNMLNINCLQSDQDRSETR